MRTAIQTILPLKESDLQKFAEDYCRAAGINCLHIPDSFWKWIYKNCNTGVRCWLYKIFGGLPDLIIQIPINDKFCLSANIELKRPGNYLRKKQKEAAARLPWIVAKTPEDVMSIITEAKNFLRSVNYG